MADRITIRAFHGGTREGARWFTTDREHAAYFGDVHVAEIRVRADRVARLDRAEEEEAFPEAEYDPTVYDDYVRQPGISALILTEHEGTGDVIVVEDDYYVTWID